MGYAVNSNRREESVLPTAYTRTHLTRQQQQQVTAFAFSMIVIADLLNRAATFWPPPATLA